jgi:hypothetical protein
MDSITAIVIGGISLAGGTGNIIAGFGGVLILCIFNNIMNLLDINPFLSDCPERDPAHRGRFLLQKGRSKEIRIRIKDKLTLKEMTKSPSWSPKFQPRRKDFSTQAANVQDEMRSFFSLVEQLRQLVRGLFKLMRKGRDLKVVEELNLMLKGKKKENT